LVAMAEDFKAVSEGGRARLRPADAEDLHATLRGRAASTCRASALSGPLQARKR
jgi:hypothetical protein